MATEVLGKPVETFLSSRDGGRDDAFVGVSAGSRSTIQCKFTSRADATLGVADLAAEASKVQSLASRGLADDYVILTNFGVSGVAAAEIEARFKAAGAKTVRTYGRDWITAQIRERPRLRMMVPRVYGLVDLSQIIDERAYLQAQYILSAMGDDLRCFVTTELASPKHRGADPERIADKITELEDREDEAVERHASPMSPVTPSPSQLATIFDDVDE